MSTRATYEVDGRVFYIHHDGYAAGAAFYFAKMIEALTVPESDDRRTIAAIEERRGGPAFAFIRGNTRAEPAFRDAHDGHGDTEHRWKVTSGESGRLMLQHSARRMSDTAPAFSPWSEREPLVDFIRRNGPAWEGGEPCPAIVAVQDPSIHWRGRELLATLPHAIAIGKAHRALADRFDDGNPNKAEHARQAEAWENAAAELYPARVSYLVKRRAELLDEIGKAPSKFYRDYAQLACNNVGRELDQLANA
jgi:hypothetical protein